jgi:hypothetical protein
MTVRETEKIAEASPATKVLAELLIVTCNEAAESEKMDAGEVYTALAFAMAYAVKSVSKTPSARKRDLVEIKRAALRMVES